MAGTLPITIMEKSELYVGQQFEGRYSDAYMEYVNGGMDTSKAGTPFIITITRLTNTRVSYRKVDQRTPSTVGYKWFLDSVADGKFKLVK